MILLSQRQRWTISKSQQDWYLSLSMFIIKTSIKNIENKASAMTFVMDDKVGSINDFLARGLLTILSIGGEQRR